MTNPKGYQFEAALKDPLRLIFPDVERRGSQGHDLGDFSETHPFTIEAKNRKKMDLPAWLRQVEAANKKSGGLFPIIIHKRRNFGVHGAWVTMSLSTFIRMIAHYNGVDLDEEEMKELIKNASDEDEVLMPEFGWVNQQDRTLLADEVDKFLCAVADEDDSLSLGLRSTLALADLARAAGWGNIDEDE